MSPSSEAERGIYSKRQQVLRVSRLAQRPTDRLRVLLFFNFVNND